MAHRWRRRARPGAQRAARPPADIRETGFSTQVRARIHGVSATSDDLGGCGRTLRASGFQGGERELRPRLVGMPTTEASVKVARRVEPGWTGGTTLGRLRIGKKGWVGWQARGSGRARRPRASGQFRGTRGDHARPRRGAEFRRDGHRIGRDRSVVWREHHRNRLPNGDYHALMANGSQPERPAVPRPSNSAIIGCARRLRRGWMTGGAPD